MVLLPLVFHSSFLVSGLGALEYFVFIGYAPGISPNNSWVVFLPCSCF